MTNMDTNFTTVKSLLNDTVDVFLIGKNCTVTFYYKIFICRQV